MKKDNYPRFFLLLVSFIFIIIVTGCSDQVNTPETDISNMDLAVFDISDAAGGISDATLDAQYTFNSPLEHRNFFRKDFSPGKSGRHLLQILRKLNLSENQKTEVKDFISEHKDCVKGPLQDLRTLVGPILADANAKRKDIIAKYKDGIITREEAKAQIEALNKATRELINNDPGMAIIKSALCDCKSNLFRNIASILTDDQKIIWNDWVNKLNGICSGN